MMSKYVVHVQIKEKKDDKEQPITDEDKAERHHHSDGSPSRGSRDLNKRYKSMTREKSRDVDRYDRRDRRRRSRERYGYSRRGEDRRSRSRSGSRSRSRRSRDRYYGKGRSSSRDRRRRRDERDYDRRHDRRDRYRDNEARSKTALSTAEDELKQLERTYRTVQVYNLSLRAEERDVFDFFKQAGRVVDIRIIRDRTTGRSKGFAYVEFEDRDSVVQAISLGGQPLLKQPVMVKMSEAEKNLAWEAAQAAKKQAISGKPSTSGAGIGPGPGTAMATPGRLTVSNLPVNIVEADLRPILEAFGPLNFITVQRDTTGVSVGSAVVQYKEASDAEVATLKLNEEGIELAPGLPMRLTLVKPLDVNLSGTGAGTVVGGASASELQSALEEHLDIDADDGGGLKLTAQNRLALMTRLAANAGLDVPTMPSTLSYGANIDASASHQPLSQAATELALEQGLLGPASPIPTQCLLIKNMFDPAQEAGADWDEEIAEDVKEECSKYGRVEFVHVDKQSKGFVYLKFDSTPSATVAQKALHGRWFDQRQLLVEYQFAPIFNSHFKL